MYCWLPWSPTSFRCRTRSTPCPGPSPVTAWTFVTEAPGGGCIISGGVVRKSLLFSDVRVHSYTTTEESVILPEVQINRHVKIRRAIIDRACEIPAGMEIGYDHDKDRANGFRVTDKGITLVTREMLGQRGGAL